MNDYDVRLSVVIREQATDKAMAKAKAEQYLRRKLTYARSIKVKEARKVEE